MEYQQNYNYNPNRSVPSIQTPHDDVADAFATMNIGHGQDPIQRSASAMSARNIPQHPQRIPPRHANTLPPQHADGYYQDYPPQAYEQNRLSGNSQYSYDSYHSDGYQQHQYQPQHYPQQQQQQWSPSPLYDAASNVLGGPPPGAPTPAPPPPHFQGPPHIQGLPPRPSPQGLSPQGLPPRPSPTGGYYPGPSTYANQQNADTRSVYSQNDTQSVYSFQSSEGQAPPPQQHHLPPQSPPDSDFELRGPVRKATAIASGAPHGKAVDLSSPPFTKEYIDEYRQRIKADPDPEAHFLYAKYLVEAAKKFRASAKDPRVGKKYSELLIGEALKVMRRLATQGDTYSEAQFFLANCHGTGALGLPVDHEKAYHLYLQAAKQNHAAAAYRVAVCNEIGAGTKREPPRAAAFYRKAASLGDTAAMYKLGMILLQGLLDEQRNPREAIGWLKRAAEQADEENPHALHELALLYENPQGNLVPHDPQYSKSLYTQAAQLGYTPSQYKLGQCYEYGALGCPVDPKRSIAWYTKAAEKGDAEAELALSGWYLTGSEGVLKQSDSEAYLWARRAANKGLSKAEYAVGYYAEVGIGVKQDVEFAKRWYMRAAAQGNKRAMNRLTEMKRLGNKRPQNMTARPTRQQAKDECVII